MADSGPDFSSVTAAFKAMDKAFRRIAERFRIFAEQVAVANDAAKALRAFVADGGDVQSIHDIERAFGVTHG